MQTRKATMNGTIDDRFICVGCHSMEWNNDTCAHCGKEHSQKELIRSMLLAEKYKNYGKL